MLGEITHLQTIADDLKSLTVDPHKLPAASEQVSELQACGCTVCTENRLFPEGSHGENLATYKQVILAKYACSPGMLVIYNTQMFDVSFDVRFLTCLKIDFFSSNEC